MDKLFVTSISIILLALFAAIAIIQAIDLFTCKEYALKNNNAQTIYCKVRK